MDKHLWQHKLFQQRKEKNDIVFVVQWVSGVLAGREDLFRLCGSLQFDSCLCKIKLSSKCSYLVQLVTELDRVDVVDLSENTSSITSDKG